MPAAAYPLIDLAAERGFEELRHLRCPTLGGGGTRPWPASTVAGRAPLPGPVTQPSTAPPSTPDIASYAELGIRGTSGATCYTVRRSSITSDTVVESGLTKICLRPRGRAGGFGTLGVGRMQPGRDASHSPVRLAPVGPDPAGPLGIVIFGADPLVRAGIRAALDDDAGIHVSDDVCTAIRLESEVRRHTPAAVVTSLDFGSRFGADDLHDLVAFCGALGVPVAAIVDPDDSDGLFLGVATGLRGCVSKFAVDDLPAAIRAVSEGARFLSSELTAALFDSVAERRSTMRVEEPVCLSKLSQRERGVLELLGTGIANCEIARRLCIKETTVRSHVHHIMTKMNLGTRAEVAILGYRQNELVLRRSPASG